jgi:LysM repeat protein
VQPRRVVGVIGVVLFAVLTVAGLQTTDGSVRRSASTTSANPTPEPRPPRPVTYTVQPGDTLSSIAEELGTTVPDLVAANELADPDSPAPADVLVVPEGATRPRGAVPANDRESSRSAVPAGSLAP